jgi:hypothetical protein
MNDQLISHIARFAMMPHWLDEMRRFTKELEATEGDFYKGLGQAVKQRIEFLKQQQKNGDSNEP